MPSELETAMETLIKIFHQYSVRVGAMDMLNKKQLKQLLHNELGNFLKTPRDQEVVDKTMCNLDQKGDGEVDFDEFVKLLSTLITASKPFFSEES